MKKDNHLTEERTKALKARLKFLSGLITKLQENYTVKSLENLQKEVHRILSLADLYGYKEASKLCDKLELTLSAKIKNFNLSKPSISWLNELDHFTKDLEKAFPLKQEISMKKTGKKETSKKVIVVVDDDDDIAHLLAYEFHAIGFDVKCFEAGRPALKFLLEEKNLKGVALIILDRLLPDMDGLDILRQFSKKFPRKVPVLILSVLGSEKDVVSGLQSGALDYITKPFSVFKLLQKAQNLLGREEK